MMQAVKQFLSLTFTEFRIFLREPVAVFFNLFFPLMFLFLTMHVFLGEESKAAGAINHFIPTFLVIITTGVSIFNIPIYIVRYRNIKFLKRLAITPVNPALVLASLAFANLLVLLFGLLIVILLGVFVYGADFSGNWLYLLFACLLSFTALSGLGWIMGARITGIRTVNVIGQLVYYPLLFLSSGIPLNLGSAEIIQKAMPTTYALDIIKYAWNPEFFSNSDQYAFFIGSPLTSISVLVGVTILSFIIAFKGFRWE